MDITKKKVRSKRFFSEDFRKNVVKEYESGKMTITELERFYQISNPLIYRWIYKYSNFNKKSIKVVEMSESGTKRILDLESKVKELERIVGQKQINIDYLEKMIEISKDEFGIDIRKKFDTPHSNGSGETKIK